MSRCFRPIGPQPLAVTTNLNINFLRKPAAGDLIAEAKLMKIGKRLAVGEVKIYSEGEAEPVAHVDLDLFHPPITVSSAMVLKYHYYKLLILHV